MIASTSDPALTTRLTPEDADALVTTLAAEMIQEWRRGQCLLPEHFLARHPGLREHPQAVAELIYEEMSLRREIGPYESTEVVLQRFPQWRPQLDVLFDCQRVLEPQSSLRFPRLGESIDGFRIVQELGRGGLGRVFRAHQDSLGARPVVLKFAPREDAEHLSLSRLQHTHIVPLYSVQDHPERGLHSLCMPYFGGASLAHLLDALKSIPPLQRTGRDLVDVLQRAEGSAPVPGPNQTACGRLARIGYVELICWIGACLADALQYAHDRGLVHLDLKPANVLLGADGQPMLLDFHLAREPIRPGAIPTQRMGGTSEYLSPEQRQAMQALSAGRAVERAVDERSDIHSLGVVLYEALTASLPRASSDARSLRQHNPRVSVGLADVIARCLAEDPTARYPSMAALAVDLRRHLALLPLLGVRNRSIAERWSKWRRRRPYSALVVAMTIAVLAAVSAVGLGVLAHFSQRTEQARQALRNGQTDLARGEFDGALRSLRQGRNVARDLPFSRQLQDDLERSLRQAEQASDAALRARLAPQLHELVDRVRFLYGDDKVPLKSLSTIDASCRTLWNDRQRIVERLSPLGPQALEPAQRDDLLDLAICWSALVRRLQAPAGTEETRKQALRILDQAEGMFGPSPVLDEERAYLGAPARNSKQAPRTAWEHWALARALLRAGQVPRAAEQVELAIRLEPQGLWPNFYLGRCASRQGRLDEALMAYSVCIGMAPQAATCFHNRALTWGALGRDDEALRDYDMALRLDPALADAALNRGVLHYRAKRYAAALADLQRAAKLGADPAAVAENISLVKQAKQK